VFFFFWKWELFLIYEHKKTLESQINFPIGKGQRQGYWQA